MTCHHPGIAQTVLVERNFNGVVALYCIILTLKVFTVET